MCWDSLSHSGRSAGYDWCDKWSCLVPGVTKELRHNLHVLHPFAIIRCNWDSWRGVFFFPTVEVSGNEAATPNRTREGRHVQGHCYCTQSMSHYHTAGLNGSATDMCLCQISLTLRRSDCIAMSNYPFWCWPSSCTHRGCNRHLSEEGRACSLALNAALCNNKTKKTTPSQALITVLLISCNGDACGIYSIG